MSPVIAPSRLPDPLSQQMLSSPLVSPDKLRFKASESRRSLQSSPDSGILARSSQPHPLSRPPITASAEQSQLNTPVDGPSPLPIVYAPPAQVAAMRRGLHSRRSSFPPGVGSSVTGANSYPWVVGGTPPASRVVPHPLDALSGYGNEIGPYTNSVSSPAAWESLLDFDNIETSVKSNPFEVASTIEGDPIAASPRNKLLTPKKGVGLERTVSSSEAWRLAVNRAVDVEGVGQVGVARILSEVWKRGGPLAVTAQGLWPSILMSLSLASNGSPNISARTPSASAALSLQALYNVAVRPHEPTVFAGLLSNYVASTAPLAVNSSQDGQVYGAWTPTKGIGEMELSQWTTFTPGEEWPSLSTTLPSGSGLTPRREFSPALGLPPIDISDPLESGPRPESRGVGDAMTGIDAILAEMEEDERLRETQSGPASDAPSQPDWTNSNSTAQASTQASPIMATPSDSDPFIACPMSSSNAEEPVENLISSPFVSGGSMMSSATSASTSIPSLPLEPADSGGTVVAVKTTPRPRAPSLQLPLPDVPFIPPPPMCMFFSPAFRDLQEGKVAVWKGDLTIRGRGGGRFNILIIGEATSGDLWKSHTWPEALSYPPGPAMTESCTATMIPVSTLAREGMLPVTMGMVLCNDENITPFVNMVQGLHAEGVAFHLPMPDTNLPIVFLPAKFDSSDPLQRLGVAFMTKGGLALSSPVAPTSRKLSGEVDAYWAPERKRRRKSTVSNGDSKLATRRNVPVRPKAAKPRN
ncbi:hypothetical protein CcaverHIS002_0508790 [Cutaneotrichosporon cavernicola]|uniref:Uncharacterized protein n=1 Tax=Cutaneotrichosporon cavernicola TaxID=279322 RepID=A0AA48L7D2_9TREE|nr:uncharacterized protein CcaverHIS019_0509360 [Cutaneotrichosporon cavernicola]BEI85478.1 hypothetical protein CcaverHIS002_0508790 [Cutaneotrichosporon cavernicola]BEI93308.1 hypothetical protein CcaverHIS019_0509360 [Cutaneotrichosporon cavernicola]BEJ01085.1 hypothetical protein CcaverHIS631_0509420 [Cutaneotrichosporon cavernicola]BEJ08853.1 hypothetical protein CcaverHIS641_0509470 [Cutaneotrichosporon cavernicola]